MPGDIVYDWKLLFAGKLYLDQEDCEKNYK